jgi:DNA-binding protein HU-beta
LKDIIMSDTPEKTEKRKKRELAAKEGKGKGNKDRNFKRQELAASVVEKTGLPRAKATAAIDAVFETISEKLKAAHEVRLLGFGAFVLTERKAGKGRDPRTGAEIDIPHSKSVRFRPGKALKEAVGGASAAGAEKPEAAAAAEE